MEDRRVPRKDRDYGAGAPPLKNIPRDRGYGVGTPPGDGESGDENPGKRPRRAGRYPDEPGEEHGEGSNNLADFYTKALPHDAHHMIMPYIVSSSDKQ